MPVPELLNAAKIKCGSGLAREGGGSVNIIVCWADLFAGKPAPTGVSGLSLPARHKGAGHVPKWCMNKLELQAGPILLTRFELVWSTAVPRIISPETPEAALTDHSEHNAKIFGSPKDRLDFYRREIQYETTILANRTDAYLTAQSFLVIAFVSGMGNLNPEWGKFFTLIVPVFLASLGVLSSLNAWPGIRAAYEIIDHWHYKQSELLRSEPVMGLAYDDSPLFCETESSHKGYRKSLLFSMRAPWLFMVFWVMLGAYAFYIQVDNPVS